MKLSPFTKADWDGFAGAEGDHPLIGYFDNPSAVVLLDDRSIQVILYEEDHPEVPEIIWDYPHKSRILAERIVAGMDASELTDDNLRALGFERLN